ncbi:hypothetical protein BT93_C1192 [Corymbia citriodora subsp. variegata]|nr:hypothetical protein BT93_C1192 [Corymbia citriodora subsp. variegata]
MERQLKILNKPPIKTFVTKEGETIDCIDINKQPSLDHPLLKNHKVQRRPSSHIISSPTYSPTSKSVIFGLREPCPLGTVPIPRVRKEDLIRAKSIINDFSLVGMNGEYPGHHLVFVLVNDLDTKYGAEAHLSCYNLTVPQDQFSVHKLSIENGPDAHLSTIHAGWGVHPTLNGDGLTRLITFWTGDSFRNGCFNTQCRGFVQTHSEVTTNYPLSPTSTYGGDTYELVVRVEQDNRSRNWWLVVRHDIAIGYWPSELFANLADGAKRVSWGGEGFSGNAGTCPPMGSGHMPDGYYNHAAYFGQINYMTGRETKQIPLAVFEHVDKSKVYRLKNDRIIRKDMGSSGWLAPRGLSATARGPQSPRRRLVRITAPIKLATLVGGLVQTKASHKQGHLRLRLGHGKVGLTVAPKPPPGLGKVASEGFVALA